MYTEILITNAGTRTWFLNNNRMSWLDRVDAHILSPSKDNDYLGKFLPVQGQYIHSERAIHVRRSL